MLLQTQTPRGPGCPLRRLHAWPGVGRKPGSLELRKKNGKKPIEKEWKRLWFDMLRGIRSGLSWAVGLWSNMVWSCLIMFDQPNAAWLPSAGLHSPLQRHQSPSPTPRHVRLWSANLWRWMRVSDGPPKKYRQSSKKKRAYRLILAFQVEKDWKRLALAGICTPFENPCFSVSNCTQACNII